jgi:hypothetical protein
MLLIINELLTNEPKRTQRIREHKSVKLLEISRLIDTGGLVATQVAGTERVIAERPVFGKPISERKLKDDVAHAFRARLAIGHFRPTVHRSGASPSITFCVFARAGHVQLGCRARD